MEYKSLTTPAATGGTVTTTATHRIHTFTSGGIFTVNKSMNVEVLVVAGGGGGGDQVYGGSGGGGGGAGGLSYNSSFAVTSQSYSVTVGNGGIAGNISNGGNGNNSIFSSLTAIGGGGGQGTSATVIGGSGGGASYGSSSPGAGTSGQGYAGGNGSNAPAYAGGGGGGSSEVGHAATSTVGGAGGNGKNTYSDLLIAANAGVNISGTRWIAGGGGGGCEPGYTVGSGGLGGGGAGGLKSSYAPTAGTANTGGGGGGSGSWYGSQTHWIGAAGGSGIVIIRYLLSEDLTPANITATNMTITPSETPCRQGICTVTIVVRWSNSGGTDGTVIPNITIDTVPQIAHTSRTVLTGSYIDETFTISGLMTGTHTICPDPN